MAKKAKQVATVKHAGDKRVGIPTAEEGAMMGNRTPDALKPEKLKYPRNPDLDPQLVWRGKDAEDVKPLEVVASPIYIQEKIHPSTLIKDLMDETKGREKEAQLDFFADFNGVPKGINKADFYHYEKNWTNRMIMGDSLKVMASLVQKEGLRGKVQCIYMDPPYGIKFNSNFQWSTTSTKETDGKDFTCEPEMVRAFRDTWKNGINSYLSYLRDRFILARELLSESGSIFVQIGDENVHRVRAVLDEVFGDENFVTQLTVRKTSGQDEEAINNVTDFIIWFTRNKLSAKLRHLFVPKKITFDNLGNYNKVQDDNLVRRPITKEDRKCHLSPLELGDVFSIGETTSSGNGGSTQFPIFFHAKKYMPYKSRHWSTHEVGMNRLDKANRIIGGDQNLSYVRFVKDFPVQSIDNIWDDTSSSFLSKLYVVQTITKIVERCILMATDPGDLVLDPTCGSGTTAYVAEQWGRRWITIDTSRVALTLARARLMGARYPYYLLQDSREGQMKEAVLQNRLPSDRPTNGDIRQGFVYERVPHITLKDIANDTEIDDIWKKYEAESDALLKKLKIKEEWQVPRKDEPGAAKLDKEALDAFWAMKIKRQKEIDKSISLHSGMEYLYDKPYEDNTKVRVAGPFTMESLDPHRMLEVLPDGELNDPAQAHDAIGGVLMSDGRDSSGDFNGMVLQGLKASGVQQSDKKDKITFESVEPKPGKYVCAEGRYLRDGETVRAGIFIGPEFGTVSYALLLAAVKEASQAGYDELIACAFNYDAQCADFMKGGGAFIPVLKARMSPELQMSGDLKASAKGNLFVVFGEPDLDIKKDNDGKLQVTIKGMDIYKPQDGEVKSSEPKDIACWFIDTDYNQQSFFIRQAYFVGQPDPYDALRKTLKAEIDEEAWDSINSLTSRPFEPPQSGFIAVKIINHLGDEALKVYDASSWS